MSRVAVLASILILTACWTTSVAAKVEVAFNQLGYLPHASKLVRVVSDAQRKPIKWQANSGSLVLKGVSSSFVYSSLAASWVSTIDLSEITREGNVGLRVGDSEHELVISNSVYDGLLQQLLRSYYLQRCGIELKDQLTQLFHAACHEDDGKVSVSNTIESAGASYSASGGWHDAGDYGKYVSTTAVTASQLLHLYERYPQIFQRRSHYIPESNNKIPDVLDEVRVGLDWLIAVQRSDGAFYRKLAGKSWPKLVPPEEDVQPRFLYGVASDDTGKAVAALARGARAFADIDKTQSARYLVAAKQGWLYLQTQNELFIDLHADDDKGSGPYRLNKIDQDDGLKHHRDDSLAAAVQLYLTTDEGEYRKRAVELLDNVEVALFEWKNPSLLSILELLEAGVIHGATATAGALRERVKVRAQKAYDRYADSAFGLANHRIIWGSNKILAAEGSLLLYADDLSASNGYMAAAQSQLDFLLGSNPHRQTFVSGVGSRPVQHVSHIFARATGKDIPGLMVGGPNEAAQARRAPKNKGLMSYIDDAASYATNEYAIDYNAALIGLVVQLISKTTDLSDPAHQ